MSSTNWTTQQIPDQSGRVAIITGSNSGIGFEAAKALAGKGATVILAVRRPDSGQQAQRAIEQAHPGANVAVMRLDLASQASVAALADAFRAAYDRLDLLINNAGVMALPYQTTEDGFEMQLGVNHFGHFALTGRLLPLLLNTAASRVVTVASNMHRGGTIDFDNLNGERGYDPWSGYRRSKLANLLFAYELQRRLAAAAANTISVAAHPGYAATSLQTKGGSWLAQLGMKLGNWLMAQPAAQGALPTLRAATDPAVQGGDYYGPDGMQEIRGYPVQVDSSPLSRDQAAAAKLWAVSEEETGVVFNFG